MIRTSNPALRAESFQNIDAMLQGGSISAAPSQVMTVRGTAVKTMVLLGLAMVTAAFAWQATMKDAALALPLLLIGALGGLLFAVITVFKKNWSPVTAPIYALVEGLALGSVSALFAKNPLYQGIVLNAVILTFGVLLCMMIAYASGLIRATEKFKIGVIAATGAIFLLYMVSWILGMFGVSMGFLHGSGNLSIGISVVIVVVAALNLILDFDMIETGAASGAPKYMEWYGAFGLMVTLVWLYFEILRLLSKLRQR